MNKKEEIKIIYKCPMCGEEIKKEVENDLSKTYNKLSYAIYRVCEEKNEPCFKCWYKLNEWVKNHKDFCIKNNIDYHKVGNLILKKRGIKIKMGEMNLEEELEDKTEDKKEEKEEVDSQKKSSRVEKLVVIPDYEPTNEVIESS